MADQNTVKVTAGPSAEPGKVILWEKNPAHPGGEVYIAAPEAGERAPEPVEAARTSDVEGHLRSGELVEAGRASAPMAPAPAPQRERTAAEDESADDAPHARRARG